MEHFRDPGETRKCPGDQPVGSRKQRRRILPVKPSTESISPPALEDKLVTTTLAIALILCVIVQKIAVIADIEVPFFIFWGAIGYLFIKRKAIISGPALIAYCGIVCLLIVTQTIAYGTDISVNALLIAIALYTLLFFRVPVSKETFVGFLRHHQNIGLVAGLLALFQWVSQALKLGMFNIEVLVPAGLLYKSYNYMQPVAWNSPWYQPNGIFFLEASLLAQFIAITLVIELALFQRFNRIVILAIAELSCLAGTGLLILMVIAPALLFVINRKLLLAAIAAAPFVVLLAGAFGIFEYLLDRTSEFSQTQSSGAGRFIEPFTILPRILELRPVLGYIAGLGAGNLEALPYTTPTLVLNPLSKVLLTPA